MNIATDSQGKVATYSLWRSAYRQRATGGFRPEPDVRNQQTSELRVDMQADFWGLLHDGGIESIAGEVPGTVSLKVSIRYLRQQFSEDGIGFRIVLLGCSHFAYQEYDSTPVENFDEIVGLEPEILGVEKGTHPLVVNCVMGSLSMSYERASIYLDSGEEVSFDELTAASKKYWDAWAANIPQRR